MRYVIGIVLSVGVALFARCVGFDRDRAFYPTVLMVIASYYMLFAAITVSGGHWCESIHASTKKQSAVQRWRFLSRSAAWSRGNGSAISVSSAGTPHPSAIRMRASRGGRSPHRGVHE
jgi:hypothetical protein